jgi:hypothetical protein
MQIQGRSGAMIRLWMTWALRHPDFLVLTRRRSFRALRLLAALSSFHHRAVSEERGYETGERAQG